MKGKLTPQQQLNVLAKIWGNDREGYVFLPWIDGRCNSKEERKAKYHEGRAFAWPGDKPAILAHLTTHTADDVYFAPCLFEDGRRIEGYAVLERALWADLDAVDPNGIEDQYRPTIAWESSPGRYQAVWLLDKVMEGASWAGNENHRLTLYLEADPSGWDTTQLLRVPGRQNFKPDYKKDNAGQPVEGQLLWDTGPRYGTDHWNDLPKITISDIGNVDLVDEEIVKAVDRHAVWGRVRLKVSGHVRDFMAVRTSRQADEIGKDQPEGRSGVQWQIMRDLADAGCTIAEIVAVVRPSVWNTFAGRSDEMKRLKLGAAKAVAAAKAESTEDEGGALEEIGADKPPIRWITDVMAVPLRRPSWLVRNVWSRGGCGFIAGDPKSYKSWIGLDLALSVATGTPFLGEFPVVGGPQPVLYIQEEDSEIVVRDRLATIVEGKAPHLHWHGYMSHEDGKLWWYPPDRPIPLGFHVRTGFIASDPGWQSWLMEIADEGKFAHIVIDTLGTTAGEVDTDRASDLMNKILRPMKDISGQTGAAITIVHHNRKSANGEMRGGSRMLGSVALHAWVDDALYVHSREAMNEGITKVRVERESKSSVEHRWVLEIPRMGINHTGHRTVWEPVTGLWDTSAAAVTGDTDIPTPEARSTRLAGSVIARKVKLLNGTQLHPVPLTRLAEAAGQTVGAIWKQVEAGIKNGLIFGDRDCGLWIP